MQFVPASEIESRLQRFQTRLRGAQVDGALIQQRTDLFYLTGTAQNGILCVSPEDEPLFLTQKSRTRAREESPLANQVPLASPRDLVETLRRNGRGQFKRLGLELDTLPANDYRRYQEMFPQAELVDISLGIRELRMVKSEFEIRQMEGAAEILRVVFAEVPAILAASEREIDACALVEAALRRQRHQGLVRIRRWNMELAGATLVAGASASRPVAFDGADGFEGLYVACPQSGGERLLRPGEPIMVDLVAGHEGYLVDKTRIFALGRLRDADLLDAHRAALKLQDEVSSRLRPGANCGQIYTQVMEIASASPHRAGFMGWGENQVAFLGHGVGLELDEMPILSARSRTTLKEGMTVAVEPKFFFGDRGGVGIENTWVVTPEGCRNLTADSSDEIVIV